MGESLNVIGMLRSPQLRSALAEVCTDMNGTRFDLRIAPLDQVTADLKTGASDLLIVEVDSKDAEDIERLRALVERRAPAAVVATAADATLNDVRQLMRLGVVDVLPQPVQRSDILAAIEVAAKSRKAAVQAAASRGRLISVLKGGGGVGATTIAVQTGCHMAGMLEKRGQKVCILDLDVQGGTVALFLDLNDRVGLADLVDSPERLDGDLLRGVMSRHATGLSVVAAPRDVMPLETFTPGFIGHLLGVAREQFDVVLVDLTSAWTLWSFEVLRQSDEVLLVTQMTVPGIRQARRQIDTLRAEGLDELTLRLVLNRYEKRWGDSLSMKEVEKALGHKIDFTVANDYRTVSEALDQGVIISDVRKRSRTYKSITRISDSLVPAGSRAEGRLEPQLTSGSGR